MTISYEKPTDDERIASVLSTYTDHPVPSGDVVVLILDEQVCLHLDGLADHWDEELCRSVTHVLTETASRVALAVARPGARLIDSDIDLWQDLAQSLVDGPVQLLSLHALPAS